jgi:hypothetical protein
MADWIFVKGYILNASAKVRGHRIGPDGCLKGMIIVSPLDLEEY